MILRSVTKKTLVSCIAVLALAGAAHAEIKIFGNQRVSNSLIESYVPKTSKITDEDIDNLVKSLHSTNEFSNISVKRIGKDVVVSVEEHSKVNSIRFDGNKKLSLQKLMNLVDLRVGKPYSKQMLEDLSVSIKKEYSNLGYVDAHIQVEENLLQGNVSNIIVTIAEGKKTGVAAVIFKGNDTLSDRVLHKGISTKERGWFSWLLNDDVYRSEAVTSDRDKIENIYRSDGFSAAEVLFADVNRDSAGYKVEFYIDEGQRFFFGDVTVDVSAQGVDPEFMTALVADLKGQVYSPTKLRERAAALETHLYDTGNPSVAVDVRPDHHENGKVDVRFVIEDASRIYIASIDIIGNEKTKDFVIRRELDFSSGDILNKVAVARAEKKIRDLGIFDGVAISYKPISADRAEITVEVAEKKTGEFSIGGGYSTTNGIVFNTSISQGNLFGTNHKFRFEGSIGEYDSGLGVKFTNPYLLGTKITAETALFYNKLAHKLDAQSAFDEQKVSGRYSLSAPISEKTSALVSYSLEQRQLTNVSSVLSGEGILSDPNLIESGHSLKSSIGYRFTYDDLDSHIDPKSGGIHSFSQEIAGIGGDRRFIRTEMSSDWYQNIEPTKDVVAHVGAKAGHITGLGQSLDFLDHFRGADTGIRGFANNGFGPRDVSSGFMLGGTMYAKATAEAIMPIPLIPVDYGLKGVVFADAGTIWSPDDKQMARSGAQAISNSQSIRSSLGIGLQWDSPFGLLRADFATPLTRENTDRTQVFSFSGGSRF